MRSSSGQNFSKIQRYLPELLPKLALPPIKKKKNWAQLGHEAKKNRGIQTVKLDN